MAFEIPFAVGNGFDVHRFREGGVLKLCGVEVPYTKSLLAHSDGDVALHALCDALLGAAALRDIGYHFPHRTIATKISIVACFYSAWLLWWRMPGGCRQMWM